MVHKLHFNLFQIKMKVSTLFFHFLFLFSRVSSSVIGIDYGTDWLKVSILKPGGAIETVLNRESKRKTNAVINIRKGIRSYGIESITLVSVTSQSTEDGP
jgi:molecular chaperone DnaK (HSP70)